MSVAFHDLPLLRFVEKIMSGQKIPIFETSDSPQKRWRQKKFWLFLGLVTAFFVITFLKIPITDKQFPVPFQKPVNTPSPSPSPFFDLTIPYLRGREYNSKLFGLEKVSENGNYTSYLTSYLADNFKIYGLLTKPTGEKPKDGYPAIIFIHGYIPPTQYQTLTRYTDHIDYLTRNGFVVFKIDLRGHGNSEGKAGGGCYSSDYIIDVLSGYSALQSTDFVDPKKIGLWGHSMAGNIALRAMAAKPEIPAVVIWAGAGYTYTDLSEFGIRDASYQPQPLDTERQRKRRELFAEYGQPKDGNPFWQLVAPTNYLKDLKGAIQLDHAVDDNVVNIGYSRNLNEILDKTSIPHEFNEYLSGGHNITGSSFTEAMQKTVDFYKKYLNI